MNSRFLQTILDSGIRAGVRPSGVAAVVTVPSSVQHHHVTGSSASGIGLGNWVNLALLLIAILFAAGVAIWLASSNRRPVVRIWLGAVSLLLLGIAIYSDLGSAESSKYWAEHGLLADVLVTIAVLAIGALLVEEFVDKGHRKRLKFLGAVGYEILAPILDQCRSSMRWYSIGARSTVNRGGDIHREWQERPKHWLPGKEDLYLRLLGIMKDLESVRIVQQPPEMGIAQLGHYPDWVQGGIELIWAMIDSLNACQLQVLPVLILTRMDSTGSIGEIAKVTARMRELCEDLMNIRNKTRNAGWARTESEIEAVRTDVELLTNQMADRWMACVRELKGASDYLVATIGIHS